MSAQSKKAELLPRAVELNKQGMTLADAAIAVGVHPVTLSKWVKDGDVQVVRRRGRTVDPESTVSVVCDQCGKEFSHARSQARRFCSRECTNNWQRENRAGNNKICPCGKTIGLEPGATPIYTYRKFCSPECRTQYGAKRQPDPANHVTFACETCGKEVTRYKKWGNGSHKFCSNECAAKHTKVKHHLVLRDHDVVLDSAWEGLLWCTAAYLKVPLERFERSGCVEWEPGHWYGPDFTVYAGGPLHIEVKGYEREQDQAKWDAFRAAGHRLVVVDHQMLDRLRTAADRDEFIAHLG